VAITIFYSWQSDRRATRFLVRDALVAAADALESRPEVAEPVRVDSDTAGISGTPPIAATVFRKIEEAAVFVADVTFVGSTSAGKLTPNPNVLLELGYAARTLGWERIVLVSNTAFGALAELPFDLRNHRFPTAFDVPDDASADQRSKERSRLSKLLGEYLANALDVQLRAAEDAFEALDHYAIELIRWNADNDRWGVNMEFGSGARLHPDHLGVSRILQLGLARTVPHRDNPGLLDYEWTHRGREVIRLMKKHGLQRARRQ